MPARAGEPSSDEKIAPIHEGVSLLHSIETEMPLLLPWEATELTWPSQPTTVSKESSTEATPVCAGCTGG